VRPVAAQASDSGAIALTAAKALHWGAAYPCHYKLGNRISDNSLPKTRGGRMMEKLRDCRTTGLGLKEKTLNATPRLSGRRIGRAPPAAERNADQVGRQLLWTTRNSIKKSYAENRS
jgi:hypothetical protein